MAAANDGNHEIGDSDLVPLRPRLLEAHAVYAREYVDATGCDTHLKHEARGLQTSDFQIMQRCSKFRQCAHDAFRIVAAVVDPEINVPCSPYVPVRVGADQQVLNAGLCERGQHVFESAVQQLSRP